MKHVETVGATAQQVIDAEREVHLAKLALYGDKEPTVLRNIIHPVRYWEVVSSSARLALLDHQLIETHNFANPEEAVDCTRDTAHHLAWTTA